MDCIVTGGVKEKERKKRTHIYIIIYIHDTYMEKKIIYNCGFSV